MKRIPATSAIQPMILKKKMFSPKGEMAASENKKVKLDNTEKPKLVSSYQEVQKQPPEVFCSKRCKFKNLTNSQRNICVRVSFFIKKKN